MEKCRTSSRESRARQRPPASDAAKRLYMADESTELRPRRWLILRAVGLLHLLQKRLFRPPTQDCVVSREGKYERLQGLDQCKARQGVSESHDRRLVLGKVRLETATGEPSESGVNEAVEVAMLLVPQDPGAQD